jgi:hypothetical protein
MVQNRNCINQSEINDAVTITNSSCVIQGITAAAASTNPILVISSGGQLTKAAGVITAPVNSSTATSAFGSISVGTAKQNTLGYDIYIIGEISTGGILTSGTFAIGVSTSATPTTNTFTSTHNSGDKVAFTAYLPNNYYILIQQTGTLTTSVTNVSMGI